MTATPTPMPAQGLRPGDKLDKYEILEQIGAGGFSVVWKAYDRLLDQPVAIKQVMLDPGADMEIVRERFRNEAELQKRVASSSPHLVKLFDFIEDRRGMFIVMEFVQGMSLEQLLVNNPGPMELRIALGYAAAVAVALDAIHKQGIIHRDLKPSNILITHDGGLKVCDFGLATLVADQATPTVGTVRYMAPELLNAERADARADIYSLGMILYEMLVGRNNFNDAFKVVLRDQRNQSLRWMKWHTNTRVKAPAIKQYNADVPDSFVELVERMMAKDVVQRITSAPQLIDTMRRQLQSQQAGANGGAVYDYAAAAAGGGMGAPMGDQTAVLPKNRKMLYIGLATAAFWVIAGLVYMSVQKSNEKKALEAKEVAVLDDYYRLKATVDGLNSDVNLDRIKWTVRNNSNQVVEPNPREKILDQTPTWPQLVEDFDKLASDVAAQNLDYLRVPQYDGKPTSISNGIKANKTFSLAMIALNNREFTDAQQYFKETSLLDVVEYDLIRKRDNQIRKLTTYDKSYALVDRLINEGKLFEAEIEYEKFIRDSGRVISEDLREKWDQLDNRINASRLSAAVTKILTNATKMAETDRSAAIEALEEWLLKNKDNPSRDVETYLTQLVGAANFEAVVTRGKDAEGSGDLETAIKEYKDAITLNAAASENLMLPSRITQLRARIAYNAGKTAYEDKDFPTAVSKLREALSYDPTLSAAKLILEQIDTFDQKETLKSLATRAFQNREYEKSINLWKQLRDEFKYDADEVAVEIAKAEFQMALAKMEAAWRGGDDEDILLACDEVLAIDSTNDRAALFKQLIQTRQLFRSRMADAKEEFKNGDYGSSKRQIFKALKIAETVEDLTIRSGLLDEANAFRDEVEYIDAMAKARRDYKLDRYLTAKGWIEVAMNHKKTDEAKELQGKIDKALEKQKAENG